MLQKDCIECGKKFEVFPSRKNQKVCSNSCKMVHRNRKEPNLRFSANTKRHFLLNKKSQLFIDGLLLGDATVSRGSSYASRLSQNFSKRYKEWAFSLQNQFLCFGINSKLGNYSHYDKRTKKYYHHIYLQTKCYPEFKIFRYRWYSNNKKEVPKDIKLVPNSIRNWYLGDGSLTHGDIQLATDGFSLNSLKVLKEKFLEFGLNFHINSNRLYLYKAADVRKFLSLIGESYPKCFAYKFGGGGTLKVGF